MQNRWFSTYAWSQVLFNLAVILWGAFVRATGSGAGCGDHWPTCNGEVIPRPERIETVIEFAHRTTSGLALLGTVVLFIWALRVFQRGEIVRRMASWTMVFMIGEAAVGAVIVLAGLTAEDASVGRAAVMAVHLCNTLLLLGSMLLTAAYSSGLPAPTKERPSWVTPVVVGATVALMFVGASGAVAALGDTLFPVESLAEGLRQDLSPTAHVLIRLRILHPALAVLTGVGMLVSSVVLAARRPNPTTRRYGTLLMALIVAQITAGVVNIVLLAPVWMQLVHLLVADLLWCAFVLLCAGAVAPVQEEPDVEAAAQPA